MYVCMISLDASTATTAAAGATATDAAAVPNDPTAYYNDFWQYSTYYGEAAARTFYGAWSPPEGTPPPAGIVVASPEAAAAALAAAAAQQAPVPDEPANTAPEPAADNGSSGAAAASTTTTAVGASESATTAEDAAAVDPEAAAAAWEAYKKQVRHTTHLIILYCACIIFTHSYCEILLCSPYISLVVLYYAMCDCIYSMRSGTRPMGRLRGLTPTLRRCKPATAMSD